MHYCDILVSKDDSCSYCVAAHTAALRSLGMTNAEIAGLEENLEPITKPCRPGVIQGLFEAEVRFCYGLLDAADFDAKEKALIRVAREANRNSLGIGDAMSHTLRQTGVQDTEIVETLGVVEVFAMAYVMDDDSKMVDGMAEIEHQLQEAKSELDRWLTEPSVLSLLDRWLRDPKIE